MANADVSWASASGLQNSGHRITEESYRFADVVSGLYKEIGGSIVNPTTFGTDSSSQEFFRTWESYVRGWDRSVRMFTSSILATGDGVVGMGDAVARTSSATSDMADDLGKYLGGGSLGTGLTGTGPNGTGITTLPPPNNGNNNHGNGNNGGPGRH